MAEVLLSYDEPVSDAFGEYRARAIGRAAADGLWEGWLEFIPAEGSGDVLITGIESRQPEREHLVYWATGLTPVYRDGALVRARRPVTVRVRSVESPLSDAPRERVVSVPAVVPPGPEPVLDPFEIGRRSSDVLRQELGALNRPRLTNIIAAYDLNPAGADLSWMSDRQLIHFIVTAVDAQLLQRSS
jgi:hypothetical protein